MPKTIQFFYAKLAVVEWITMDLFDHSMKEKMEKEAPLAARLRPITFEDFVGQIFNKNPLDWSPIRLQYILI